MKKEELIKELQEATKVEEAAVQVYGKHYIAFSSRFDLDERDKNRKFNLAGSIKG